MFGKNRHDRNDRHSMDRHSMDRQGDRQDRQFQDSQDSFQNRDRSQRSSASYGSFYGPDRQEASRYEGGRNESSRYSSDDRSYSMNDRDYRDSQDWNSTRQSEYRGQPGLRDARFDGYSAGSNQGYRAYQDYEEGFSGRRASGMGSMNSSQNRGHYGKGPKGYKRSDEKIHDEVCDVLTTHYDIDASEIEVEVKDGVVTLGGAVESRETKRLAEDVVADMNGVMDVRNNLRILSHDSRQLEMGSQSSAGYRSPSASTDSSLSSRASKSTSTSGTSTTRQ